MALAASLQLACNRSAQTYIERGDRLVAQGKDADAEIQYRKSVAQDPKFAEGYYKLGTLETKLQHWGDALDDLQRAADFDRNNLTYATALANVSVELYQAVPSRRNLYEQAAHTADVLLKHDPNSFDGHRLKGDVLVIDRKYDEALAELRKADSVKPNQSDVILAIVQVLFAEHQDRDGEALAEQYLKTLKDFPPMNEILVKHYAAERRPADVERVLVAEIAANANNARPRLQLASLYRQSGRPQDMSRVLQTILSDRAHFAAAPAAVGDFYADARNWDAALAQYRAGLEQASESDKLQYQKRIERALNALGRRDEALAEVDEILKKNPKDPDMLLEHAVLLNQSKNAKLRGLAIDEFKALATQYPGNAPVHYNLGLAYLTRGDPGSAWRELQKSANAVREYVPPRLVLADVALADHNYLAAREEAEQVLALEPNNLQARLLHAAALVGSKSYQRAEIELKSLAELEPDSEEVGLQLATLAADQKDYAKAEKLYERFYRRGSSDLRPLQGLLELYVLEHKPEKAQSVLQDELKQEPESRPVHLLLASVATQQGKFDLASQQYRWLQEKDPKSVQAYTALGDLYQRQGSIENALASYQKARELSPSDPKIVGAIAVLESNAGHTQKAIEAFKQQLALDPNNLTAMNNLAFELADTGTELDRALALAQIVSRKVPDDPGVADTLGWVYTKRGLNQSAIQVLRQLVKKHPNEPAYHYHLGVVFLQNKQPSDAKRELTAALSDHPSQDLTAKIQNTLAQIR